ncbi:expressed protein, partial [Phakopsora pachyrhizi]
LFKMLFNSNVILFALTFALGLLYQGSEAQDLAGQPNCGQNCLLTAFTTLSNGCTQTDFACLCKSQKFTGTSNLRYSLSCTSTEAATTKSWGAKVCRCPHLALLFCVYCGPSEQTQFD